VDTAAQQTRLDQCRQKAQGSPDALGSRRTEVGVAKGDDLWVFFKGRELPRISHYSTSVHKLQKVFLNRETQSNSTVQYTQSSFQVFKAKGGE
jgi:hypothetical protein